MIIPALLTTNERIAQERIALAKHMGNWLHVDVLDNTLYDFTSLPLEALKRLNLENLMVEYHCMVENPLQILDANLPYERIIVHYEADDWQSAYNELAKEGVDTWVALGPSLDLDDLILPEDVNGLVVMGVEPGQTGQSILPDTYERVELLREHFPNIPITVDGGINAENVRDFIALGVDNLIMSSALFSQKDPVAVYKTLNAITDPLHGVSALNPES